MNKAWFIVKLFLIVLVYFIFIQEGIEKGEKEFHRRNWKAIEGKLITVQLIEKPHSVSKKYISIALEYAFEWNGSLYKGSELKEKDQMYPATTDLKKLQDKKEHTLGLGAPLSVWVNPEDQTESTLEAPSSSYLYQILFGVMAELALIIMVARDLKKEFGARKAN